MTKEEKRAKGLELEKRYKDLDQKINLLRQQVQDLETEQQTVFTAMVYLTTGISVGCVVEVPDLRARRRILVQFIQPWGDGFSVSGPTVLKGDKVGRQRGRSWGTGKLELIYTAEQAKEKGLVLLERLVL